MSARALFLLLCLAASAVAQSQPAARDAAAKEAEPDSSSLFRRARELGEANAPSAFEFELSGYSYHITPNGNGRRRKGEEVRLFNLRLDGSEVIERVFYQEYHENVLLVCWLGGVEGGAAFVARLGQPSMRARWKQRIPRQGVAAVREGGSLYLTGRGLIGRLDLKTGEYRWRHDDAPGPSEDETRSEGREGGERKVSLPSVHFGPPELAGDTAVFREEKASGGLRPRAVYVNRKSGKIIRIE